MTFAALIRSFTATATTTGVRAHWNVFGDEDISGYRIYRKSGEGDPVSITPELLSTRTHLDRDVEAGQRYEYTMGVHRADLPELRSTPATVEIPAGRIALRQNFPTPFVPSTTIPFDGPAGVSPRVFDGAGRTDLTRRIVLLR